MKSLLKLGLLAMLLSLIASCFPYTHIREIDSSPWSEERFVADDYQFSYQISSALSGPTIYVPGQFESEANYRTINKDHYNGGCSSRIYGCAFYVAVWVISYDQPLPNTTIDALRFRVKDERIREKAAGTTHHPAEVSDLSVQLESGSWLWVYGDNLSSYMRPLSKTDVLIISGYSTMDQFHGSIRMLTLKIANSLSAEANDSG